MIAKIGKSAVSSASPLYYNEQKVEEGVATVLATKNIFTTELNPSLVPIEDKLKTFRYYETQNDRTSKLGFHVSLNPKIDENISDEKLSQMAEEYMELMGYADQPYIVYKHTDIDRTHIHIVSTRVDSEGKKINDSHEYSKSWMAVKKLVKVYGLEQIGVEDLTKKERFEKRIRETKKTIEKLSYKGLNSITDTSNNKCKILKEAISYAKEMHCKSFNEFRTVLNTLNVDVSLQEGITSANKEYRGLIFRVKDSSQPNILSHGIKGSTIIRGLNIEELEKSFKQNKKQSKQDEYSKKALIKNLEYIMKSYKQMNLQTFERLLEDKGIKCVTHQNTEGRIYGVTFIDNVNKAIFKGSEVGLSANKLNEYISNDVQMVFSNYEISQFGKLAFAEFNKLKRKKYFFESTFIENIEKHTDELLANIKERTPDLDNLQREVLFKRFIDAKITSLESVIAKEDNYLMNQAENYMTIASEQIEPSLHKEFLTACNINLISRDDILVAKFKAEGNIRNIPIISDYLDMTHFKEIAEQEEKRTVFFNKKERIIIQSLEHLETIKFDTIDEESSVYKFLPEKKQLELRNEMVKQFIQNNANDIEKLFNNGIIITPQERGEYAYMYYKDPSLKISLSEDNISHIGENNINVISKQMINKAFDKFTTKEIKVSKKYDTEVQLERLKNNKDIKKLDFIVDGLFYKDKRAHYELRKELSNADSFDTKIKILKNYVDKLPQSKKKGKRL